MDTQLGRRSVIEIYSHQIWLVPQYELLRPTEWLSGSGGTGETLSQLSIISGKPTLFRAAEPAVRLV